MTLFLTSKVNRASLVCLKPFTYSDEMALFVTFAPAGIIKAHVLPYVQALKEQNIAIVLIIATAQTKVTLGAELLQACSAIFVRQNSGFDFAAWAHLLHEYSQLYQAKLLYLLNDSMIGPTNKNLLQALISRIRKSSADCIGLTDNFDEYRSPRHLQSYFLALKATALSARVLQQFMRRIVPYQHKSKVIAHYETQLTACLEKAGLHCEALFPATSSNDPTLFHWQRLLNDGFPFLKVAVADDRLPLSVDNRGWQTHLAQHGYELALQALTPVPALNACTEGASVAIYQIFYQKKQQHCLDKYFIPYDNDASFAPQLCEYGVFKKIFDAAMHQQYDYVGAVSWKFNRKTGLNGEQFIEFIKQNPGYDVYFVNPFPKETRHQNVWVQGDCYHPEIKALTQGILTHLHYDIDLSSLENDVHNTAYCNYWVGNARFWEQYMAFTLPIYYYILYESPLYLRNILLKKCADKKINAPYFPFIFERLFSTLLVTDPALKYLKLDA